MFDKLPNKEEIQDYLNCYAGYDESEVKPSSLDHLLRFWAENKKQYLYNLLGENFIIEKKFEYEESKNTIYEKIAAIMLGDYEFFDSYNNFIHEYIKDKYSMDIWEHSMSYYRSHADEYPSIDDKCGIDVYHILSSILRTDPVYNEIYQGDSIRIYCPNDKIIQIKPGMKIMRILGKIAEAYNLAGFEDFRIKISQAFNKRKLTGKVCLSIHPLDYMTLSDNSNGWESCMNWRSQGCYRMGTVEMMNSPCVLVAYLKSETENIYFADEYSHWNSKKWRNLIIVTPEVISTIKGYPYQDENLDNSIVEWVKELALKNLNWNYEKSTRVTPNNYDFYFDDIMGNEKHIKFTSNFMYNDFGNSNSCTIAMAPEVDEIEHCYSGPTECMCCGNEIEIEDDPYRRQNDATSDNLEEPSSVICDECMQKVYCDHCGCRIRNGNDEYYVDGMNLCYDCFNNGSICVCDVHDNVHLRENCTPVCYFESDPTEAASHMLLKGGIHINKDTVFNNFFILNDELDEFPIHKLIIRRDSGYVVKQYYVLLDELDETMARDIKWICDPSDIEKINIYYGASTYNNN